MSTVRLLSWNIHGTLGRNPRYDLAGVVELIARWQPHIVALQEVDSRRQSDVDPFEFLQRELGEHGIGAKSIITEDGGGYGQMLISRWPLSATEIHDISFAEREPRRAIATCIDTPSGPLRVVATHLGLSIHERRAQTQTLMALANDPQVTTVIMGDFNDWFWPGSVRSVLSRAFPARTRFRTFPSRCPLLRLDRIYCRPRSAFVQCFTDRAGRLLSDHLPVIADVMPS